MCKYDGAFLGRELFVGTPNEDEYQAKDKYAYRCLIENGHEYLLSLDTYGVEGEIKYYTRMEDGKFQEIVWGNGQRIALSSSDSYVYILLSAPEDEGITILIGIY